MCIYANHYNVHEYTCHDFVFIFLLKVNAMHGVGQTNVVSRDSFPSFPSHFVPSRPHITAMFLKDYWENKGHILRELRAVITNHGLAVDHQRKVIKRTAGGEVVGNGGQKFTICGDFGDVCGVYVVPDTSLSWARKAMEEVIERHKTAGGGVPKVCIWIAAAVMGCLLSHPVSPTHRVS